jgi:hypothetical protein
MGKSCSEASGSPRSIADRMRVTSLIGDTGRAIGSRTNLSQLPGAGPSTVARPMRLAPLTRLVLFAIDEAIQDCNIHRATSLERIRRSARHRAVAGRHQRRRRVAPCPYRDPGKPPRTRRCRRHRRSRHRRRHRPLAPGAQTERQGLAGRCFFALFPRPVICINRYSTVYVPKILG